MESEIQMLCTSLNLDIERVLGLDDKFAFRHLIFDREKAAYQERLNDLRHKQTQRQGKI